MQSSPVPADCARYEGQFSRRAKRQRALYCHDWVVYAKTPLGGPAQTLEYLSRYTHRTAIGNGRVKAVFSNEMVFTVRGDQHGGKRTESLQGEESVRRYLLHILSKGIQPIRHYGVLASACKTDKLAQARLAMQMPAPNPKAAESTQAFTPRLAKIAVMQCPFCDAGTPKVVATLAASRQLLSGPSWRDNLGGHREVCGSTHVDVISHRARYHRSTLK